MKHAMAGDYIEGLVNMKLGQICDKTEIKQYMRQKKEMRTQARAIESNNRRIVHFMFNPGQPCKMTPFTRKFVSYLNKNLEEQEANDREMFDGYIDKIIEERLEEGETNPI